MNPMMIVQAAGAAAGLIGGFIPDKTRQVERVVNVEGSDLAGRVPGAVGAQSISTFSEEKYQSPLKKGLLKTSAIAGAVGSLGGAMMPGLKMPALGGSTGSPAKNMSELSSTLHAASASFKPFQSSPKDSFYSDTVGELPSDLALKPKAFNTNMSGDLSQIGELPEDGLVIPAMGRAKGI